MRVSTLFGQTLREPPSDVEAESQRLLLRGGYIRALAAGIYSYLPLAWRSIRKVEQVLREEMDRIDGQEINMPVVHPSTIWEESGRYETVGSEMVRFEDRAGRAMVLAMTHEEVVAALARSEISSYRQLPKLVYQMQTKFRDEPRARGGLIRVREFIMKDSYSLDRDEAGLTEQYVRHYDAYFRIGARVGLPLIAVESDSGMMGGKVAHEFMYLTEIGEDTLAIDATANEAMNAQVARFVKTPVDHGPEQPMETVHTPGTKTIEEVASFLEVPPTAIAKIVFFVGTFPGGEGDGAGEATKVVAAVVRGDMTVNPTLVQNLAGALELREAHDEQITAVGAVPGFASPIGLDRARTVVVVDDLVAEGASFVVGANEPDHHVRHARCGRDFEPDRVGHCAAVYEGAGSPFSDATLSLERGIEVGNIFQLGTRYSAALDATFTDEDGELRPIVMGSYGIGVGRMLACIAEEHRDEHGLIWPISVAPYHVSLVVLARSEQTAETAERLRADLEAAGVEVLFDDRDVRPGVKFADADLWGMPIRLTVSDRSLGAGGVEFKLRREADARVVPLGEIIETTVGQVKALFDELERATETAPRWADRATPAAATG